MNNKQIQERRAQMVVIAQDLEKNGTPTAKIVNHLKSEYGITERAAYGILKTARESAPDGLQGMNIAGKSVLYDAEGKIKLQWVKAQQDKGAEAIKALVEDLKDDMPRFKPVKRSPVKMERDDLLAVYPMGDPHLGLLAWDKESGDDHNLEIGERELCEAVERLVHSAPPCKEAIIANLGDFFHADNLMGETMRSHHKLDTDTRWLKVLRAGIRAMIRCIQSALAKHEKVTVINAIGNHDDHSSMMLSTVLAHLFGDDPRVDINDAPTIKHYYKFGKVLIGVHHGHTIKKDRLPLQMSSDRPRDWGDSEHRYWLTGHIHHDSRREYDGGVIVESFRTLAGKDAWTAQNGYSSGRDMKCIVYHRKFGEVERHTVSVEMLRANIEESKGRLTKKKGRA
jgi:hypothetical protein